MSMYPTNKSDPTDTCVHLLNNNESKAPFTTR